MISISAIGGFAASQSGTFWSSEANSPVQIYKIYVTTEILMCFYVDFMTQSHSVFFNVFYFFLIFIFVHLQDLSGTLSSPKASMPSGRSPANLARCVLSASLQCLYRLFVHVLSTNNWWK
jgi:hypothetical protein